MKIPRLHGLVLAGGRSSRMRRDKAALEFRAGETQLDVAMKLLEGRVAKAFVSVRADQRDDAARARYPHIVDRGDIEGPIAGISAAFSIYPDMAWLVLACDLPFLDASTLDTLLLARDPNFDATAFRSSHDGLPEPLCAIYEPAARVALNQQIAAGWWELASDQAAVIDFTPPACRYWSFTLSNYWGQSLDYTRHRTHLNARSAARRADGAVRLIVAHRDPGESDANWLETAGHDSGVWQFRWLGASGEVPIPTPRIL